MRKVFAFSVTALCLALASEAAAQVCAGGPELSSRNLTHLASVGSGFADGMKGVGGSYGIGNHRAFAMGGMDFTHFSALAGTQKQVFGTGGFNVFDNGSSRFAACPTFGFMYGFGPTLFDSSLRSTATQIGGRVGFRAIGDQRYSIVPTAGVSWAGQSLGTSFYGDNRLTEYYGVAVFGAGVRFNNNRLAVVPALSVPFAIESSDVSFQVNVTTSF
jgi:hypothetical protein